ncbi:MAG: polysaccharide deacetylase [Gemmatimonadetes bacterium]|nr:polysaccharide deacetylase [Gemmatimonadota bacterium]
MSPRGDSAGDERLAVYYTVDTEVWWARGSHDGRSGFADEFRRWFHGATPRGDYGVPFQMRLLSEHGLKGVFFVEPLFAAVVGSDPLEEMVECILEAGHDVQLHAHVEWLRHIDHPVAVPGTGPHIRSFGLADQKRLLGEATRLLTEAGAPHPTAFRAGNFGADDTTLAALAQLDIGVDSSLDRCYLDDDCRISGGAAIRQPRTIGETLEVPVSAFVDYPGHLRPVHLNACGFGEVRHALQEAERLNHPTFVMVSHSFELLNGRQDRPDRVVLGRFEKLCRFLADHEDRFRTADFREPVPGMEPSHPDVDEIVGQWRHTTARVAGQAWSRVAYR